MGAIMNQNQKRYRISTETIVFFALLMYFCAPLLQVVYNTLFRSLIGKNGTTLLTLLTIYLPVLLVCVVAPRKYIKVDFAVLLLCIIAFFFASLLFHPEYAYWYGRQDYGIWNYVFIPTEGIYAYLFIRLMDDPAKLQKGMKTAGWIMIIYFLFSIYRFLSRGYWYGVAGQSNHVEMDHSVSIGYSMMQFLVFFLYDALRNKRRMDIIGAAIYAGMILVCGSRGPVLFTFVFLAIYFIKHLGTSRHKAVLVVGVSIAGGLLYAFYNQILMLISVMLRSVGASARIVNALLSGNFTNDSGRTAIWMAAIDMIRENPWGHGAMGSQPVISKLIYAGYPHSVILEILIDFGVLFGSIILIVLFYNAFLLLFSRKYDRWWGVFLSFFATACQLFISICYWSSPPFWAAIGVCVNARKENKWCANGKGEVVSS